MLPALPDDIDPDNPHVEVYVMQCRTCGAYGPVVSMADRDDPNHRWDLDHSTMTDGPASHTKFYRWLLTRNTARIM